MFFNNLTIFLKYIFYWYSKVWCVYKDFFIKKFNFLLNIFFKKPDKMNIYSRKSIKYRSLSILVEMEYKITNIYVHEVIDETDCRHFLLKCSQLSIHSGGYYILRLKKHCTCNTDVTFTPGTTLYTKKYKNAKK